MPGISETTLEIDLNALGHNYRYLTRSLRPDTKVLAVVKAFGYGSDAIAVARELGALGAAYFAVAYSNEGEALRDAGIQTPILVLHPLPGNFDTIIDRCLEPALYSEKILEAFMAFAAQKGQSNYPVHIKINTGLNRLGFKPEEVPGICERLKDHSSVKVRSVFSHLAASEDLALKDFTTKQISLYQSCYENLRDCLGYSPMQHVLNTSGIINFPEAQFDMVRTGIGIYGFGNDKQVNKALKPVATLKTVISQIHEIRKGESVGYNMGFVATKPTTSATLPLGHADGISRAYGKGKGWVMIKGKKAPILGNVCMDMIMVDVTGIPCKEGDEVIVFGKNPSATELAASINSIPYELLTAISQRIKRVLVRK